MCPDMACRTELKTNTSQQEMWWAIILACKWLKANTDLMAGMSRHNIACKHSQDVDSHILDSTMCEKPVHGYHALENISS